MHVPDIGGAPWQGVCESLGCGQHVVHCLVLGHGCVGHRHLTGDWGREREGSVSQFSFSSQEWICSAGMYIRILYYRVAKFESKVGSRRTTKISYRGGGHGGRQVQGG